MQPKHQPARPTLPPERATAAPLADACGLPVTVGLNALEIPRIPDSMPYRVLLLDKTAVVATVARHFADYGILNDRHIQRGKSLLDAVQSSFNEWISQKSAFRFARQCSAGFHENVADHSEYMGGDEHGGGIILEAGQRDVITIGPALNAMNEFRPNLGRDILWTLEDAGFHFPLYTPCNVYGALQGAHWRGELTDDLIYEEMWSESEHYRNERDEEKKKQNKGRKKKGVKPEREVAPPRPLIETLTEEQRRNPSPLMFKKMPPAKRRQYESEKNEFLRAQGIITTTDFKASFPEWAYEVFRRKPAKLKPVRGEFGDIVALATILRDTVTRLERTFPKEKHERYVHIDQRNTIEGGHTEVGTPLILEFNEEDITTRLFDNEMNDHINCGDCYPDMIALTRFDTAKPRTITDALNRMAAILEIGRAINDVVVELERLHKIFKPRHPKTRTVRVADHDGIMQEVILHNT